MFLSSDSGRGSPLDPNHYPKKCIFLFKSSKELTLVVRSGNAQNKIVDVQNGKHFVGQCRSWA